MLDSSAVLTFLVKAPFWQHALAGGLTCDLLGDLGHPQFIVNTTHTMLDPSAVLTFLVKAPFWQHALAGGLTCGLLGDLGHPQNPT